eukprot:829252_1
MAIISFFKALTCLLIIKLASSQNTYPTKVVGTYFPNWAQYTASPYTFTPASLKPIISKLNVINYAFSYFCPSPDMYQPYWVQPPYSVCNGKQPFQITNIEYNDPTMYKQIINYKSTNPNLKVMISVGGWNFPSNFYSTMVANQTARTVFIQSVIAYMDQYGFDGLDIDWEYPGSAPRTDEVRISCTEFRAETDKGGDPVNDRANLLKLVQEARQAFGTKYLLTVATQADVGKANAGFNIAEMSKVIDAWNLMSYDYTVSADTDPSFALTAPNEPLFPPNAGPLPNDSVSTTIDGYIASGADPSKLVVGIAFYGHTWYLPGLKGDEWKQMGKTGQIQGECCGPLKQTYGAKYAEYYQQCGSYMYSQIQAAGFQTWYDSTAGTNIGYMNSTAKDGWTAEGVWIAYQGPETVSDICKYAKSKGLRGAFNFDISQDSYKNGFDFELTNQIYTDINS